MKHASLATLDELEPLLAQLRGLGGMVEKKRGVFYRKSQAFLHFHEDPKGLFADLRAAGSSDFERFDVTGWEGRQRLLDATAARLKA